LRWADPPSKESYRLRIDEETEKAAKVHKSCTAIDTPRWIDKLVPNGEIRLPGLTGRHMGWLNFAVSGKHICTLTGLVLHEDSN
jgi:hypothetical protein